MLDYDEPNNLNKNKIVLYIGRSRVYSSTPPNKEGFADTDKTRLNLVLKVKKAAMIFENKIETIKEF